MRCIYNASLVYNHAGSETPRWNRRSGCFRVLFQVKSYYLALFKKIAHGPVGAEIETKDIFYFRVPFTEMTDYLFKILEYM